MSYQLMRQCRTDARSQRSNARSANRWLKNCPHNHWSSELANNFNRWSDRLVNKIHAGNLSAVSFAANAWFEEASAVVEEPTVGPRGGISFQNHSSPGEFPHWELGQGARNIAHGADRATLTGRVGVLGESTGFGPFKIREGGNAGHQVRGGRHLIFLERNQQRLGIVSLWQFRRPEIRAAWLSLIHI